MSVDDAVSPSIGRGNLPGTPLVGSHLRLSAVDHLRGLVMVVMVLDHTRDFFMNSQIDPTDLSKTTLPLFFTRWVTHYCAPVFVFLAGTGAFLAGARGKSRGQLSLFLLTRGLWLIVLELTAVKLGWYFRLDYSFVLLTVLWAIGGAMVVLSALVFLPVPMVAAVGLAIVVGHNLWDGAPPSGVLGALLRPTGFQPAEGVNILVAYSLIPWTGVMACGYGFGSLMLLKHRVRRRTVLVLGAVLTIGFVLVRGFNHYGDPRPWVPQPHWSMSVASFLNCQKYPPSLDYLLMTLGPALMLLAWFDRPAGVVGRQLIILGRVPLFYYLLQWYIIHALAVVFAILRGDPTAWLFKDAPFQSPPGYGFGLPIVYGMWALAVVLLYFPCRWFAALKQRRRDPWLSYL
ncbi:DUF1624 domain-containing protein [Singulisphaera rosea]